MCRKQTRISKKSYVSKKSSEKLKILDLFYKSEKLKILKDVIVGELIFAFKLN